MVAVHVLRVFIDPEGRWGHPLAVFLDGAAITERMRLAVAAELGCSETVFVDDVNRAEVRIFSRQDSVDRWTARLGTAVGAGRARPSRDSRIDAEPAIQRA
jgi:hypothetical protein